MPGKWKERRRNYVTIFVGVPLSGLGIILLAMHTCIPDYFFTSMFVLTQNSPILNLWVKNPMELITNFYFYNWTNPEDFHNRDIKPTFQQVGPYKYNLNVEKVNVEWNDNNNTITYNQLRRWSFIEEYKNACLSDKITTLNSVTAIAVHSVKNWNYYVKRALSLILTTDEPDLHMTATPQQLLFDGYEHTLVDLFQYMPFFAPEFPNVDRFGWLRLINGSSEFEGVFNSANGIGGSFEMFKWNYDEYTSSYSGFCSKVHGSPGEFFNRKATKDHIGFFAAHVCRYIPLDFEKEDVVDGIPGYKYSIGPGMLDNGTKIKANHCYCGGECIPSGLLNSSSCRYGAPLFGSLPHYQGADPVFLSDVDGLNPEKVKHETYIVIEPKTGIPLKAALRFQVNLLLQPDEDLSLVADVRKIFFPMWWIEQEVTIPEVLRTILNIYLIGPKIVIAVGSILLISGLYILLFKTLNPIVMAFLTKNSHEKKQLKNEEMPLQYKAEYT